MKLTKTEFKTMIKECIKELIKEGVFNSALKESLSSVPRSQQSTGRRSAEQSPPLDAFTSPESFSNPFGTPDARSIASKMVGYDELLGAEAGMPVGDYGSPGSAGMPINPAMKQIIENTARAMGKGNAVHTNNYAAIFADTAMHTYPNQLMNDPSRGGGFAGLAGAAAAGMQEQVNTEQLKHLAGGGGADMTRWAKVAFGGGKSSK